MSLFLAHQQSWTYQGVRSISAAHIMSHQCAHMVFPSVWSHGLPISAVTWSCGQLTGFSVSTWWVKTQQCQGHHSSPRIHPSSTTDTLSVAGLPHLFPLLITNEIIGLFHSQVNWFQARCIILSFLEGIPIHGFLKQSFCWCNVAAYKFIMSPSFSYCYFTFF